MSHKQVVPRLISARAGPLRRGAPERSLPQKPGEPPAVRARQDVLELQDEKLDAACADLEEAIKSDYSYSLAYVVLGAAYNLKAHFDDAARALERGIVLDPASWQAYFELSKALLGKGQFEAALRQVNKAGELAPPNFASIHLVRAHALLGIKNYNQAITELEQFVNSEPNSADSARARETMNQVRAFMAGQGK